MHNHRAKRLDSGGGFLDLVRQVFEDFLEWHGFADGMTLREVDAEFMLTIKDAEEKENKK